jgi:thioredoxin reductase
MYEVLIAGAGPAGMSAGLVLARCRRNILLCGSGPGRNHASHGIHGLLTHEGQHPSQFIAAAAEDLRRYPMLHRRDAEVSSVVSDGTTFKFTCSDGSSGSAKKVLLATGLMDELPQLRGIEAFYGRTVHHCLYCDGYEYADKPLAAFGESDKGAGLALMMKQWSPDVLLVTAGGQSPSAEMRRRLAEVSIGCLETEIERLEGDGGALRRIVFADGTQIEREALFFATGCSQRSDLWQTLGCTRDDKGGIIIDPLSEETSVPGVYVAGDISRDVLLIAVALAEGAKAAVAINRALLREDRLL